MLGQMVRINNQQMDEVESSYNNQAGVITDFTNHGDAIIYTVAFKDLIDQYFIQSEFTVIPE